MKLSSKRMINFTFLIFICILAAFLIKGTNAIGNYSEIIGALFFVYGILSAYYLTKMQDTEASIGEQTMIEASSWKLLYLYYKNKWPKLLFKISDLIYEYIKEVYSFEYREYHKSDTKFYKIIDYLLSLKYGGEITSIYDYLKSVQDSRESQKILYKKSKSTRVYLLLYVLLIISVLSIYAFKGNDFLYNIIVGSFSAAMILVMQIIVEKKSLAGDEYNTFFRPFDELIDLMGKKRVYAESVIKYGLIDTKLLSKKKIPYEIIKGK
ncbi:MAG: hypothetical protein WC393_00570 [Candidatus Nanoarchaeia archaeon]|jgi:hypothetical protein